MSLAHEAQEIVYTLGAQLQVTSNLALYNLQARELITELRRQVEQIPWHKPEGAAAMLVIDIIDRALHGTSMSSDDEVFSGEQFLIPVEVQED